VGHTHGLFKLLVSDPDDVSPLSGHQLIAQKLKRWVALGALGADHPEGGYGKDWNFFFNGTAPATEYLAANLPVPAYFVNAGDEVLTGRSLKFTPPGNIVRTAYRDWLWNVQKKTLDDQRPSWDLIAVMYAVVGTKDFLRERSPGWLDVDAARGARWVLGENQHQHTYLVQNEGVEVSLADYLNRCIAEPPRHRRPN
jgi:hypothetical protein